jgi:DNA-directed RNA polymerase specialized sigma24 family protein
MDLNSLIENYTENLMRGAFSLGFNDVEAEELVQDTFYAYLEGGSRFEGRSRLLTYLFGILYNKARTSWRYRDRHDSIDAAVDASFNSNFDSEDHWNEEVSQETSEVERKFAHGVYLKRSRRSGYRGDLRHFGS